jgi:four helix bundle protein
MDNSKRKPFDLEERTLLFAKNVRKFIIKLPGTISNREDSKQLIRSSGSVGANYIEANEAVSKKDFLYRVRLSRKEAKESVYWLRLISGSNKLESDSELSSLIREGQELKKILSDIVEKSK